MRPTDTENDLYNYHLQHLVGRGLVAKRTGGYRLTTGGTRYIAELNPVTAFGESHRFKLASLCLVMRGEGDQAEFLYQRRLRQPDAGEQGIIGGGIKRGELATTAARRRLWEEAGLTGSFQLLGLIRKRRFDPQGDIFSDILFHVCFSRDASGELEPKNAYGEQYWAPAGHAVDIEKHGAVGSPKFAAILERVPFTPLGDIPMFYIEEDYEFKS
jgi:8-oxo-dGTP pyrophosphatase MutT (NUDIX family)